MARNYVTRIVKTTTVEYKAIDIRNEEIFTEVVELAGHYASEERVLKAVKKIFDTDDVKVIAITSFRQRNDMRGMDIDTFIENSVPLDAETRKPIVK